MSASTAEVLDAETPQRAKWRSALTRFDMKYSPYFFIAPFYLLFAVFGIWPLIYNGIASLQNRSITGDDSHSWTLHNYDKLFHDADFFESLFTSFGLFALSTFPQLLFALVLASLLNRQLRAQTLLRMGVLVPYITPIAASTLVFANVFANDIGLVNQFLGLLGIENINFRASRPASWFAIITMINWRWTGYWAIIFLASMQSIPKDLYEAATVDGAGPWTQFWKLTVPLLRPMIIFSLVISSIGGLQLFTEPMLFGDNPSDALGGGGNFQTVAVYIYYQAQLQLNYGYAAALSWALFVIIVAVALINAAAASRIGRRS
jgi:cellobiose transport system permease protein